MAKSKKESRIYVTMECTGCSERNYRTSKQTKPKGQKKQIEKLNLQKFCRRCGTHVEHRERKK